MLKCNAENNLVLDLNAANDAVEFAVVGLVRGGATAAAATGSWGSTVITFERSINKTDWFGFATPVTLSAPGFVVFDCSDCIWVRARVSTAAGSAATGRVAFCGKGD